MPRFNIPFQLAQRKRIEEINKMSEDELIDSLLPHGFWEKFNYWLCFHIPILFKAIWKTVCTIKPWSTETHSRHWRWEKEEDWPEYK